MELKLEKGDYVPDGAGGLRRVEGMEALGQRVVFKLTARRGQFPFLEDLGSRLWKLGRVPAPRRQAAAEQYVAEALADEAGVALRRVTLGQDGGQGTLTVELDAGGEALLVRLRAP